MFEFTERQQWALDKFRELSAELGSGNKAGEQVGVSNATMSAIRSGTYRGNVDNQLAKLIAYFETKEEAAGTYDPTEYVDIGIVQRVRYYPQLSAQGRTCDRLRRCRHRQNTGGKAVCQGARQQLHIHKRKSVYQIAKVGAQAAGQQI